MTEEKINPNVEKILAKIEILEKKIDSAMTSSVKPEEKVEEKAEEHKHFGAEIFNPTCPECQKVKETLGKEYLDAHWRDKLPDVCESCGEGVLHEEEKCPKCRGTKAKKRA